MLYRGTVVERGRVEEILTQPRHPYTVRLISSIPRPGMSLAVRDRAALRAAEPGGCVFAARCDHRFDRCAEDPGLLDVEEATAFAAGSREPAADTSDDKRIAWTSSVVEGARPTAGTPRGTVTGERLTPRRSSCCTAGRAQHLRALGPYDTLAATGRRVIRYDQIGCGRSSLADVPHERDMWSIALFVEEIDNLRAHLGLDRIHILGHSWGGQLALEYALTGARGIRSLTLQSTLASIEEWVTESERLVSSFRRNTASRSRRTSAASHPGFEAAARGIPAPHPSALDVEPNS